MEKTMCLLSGSSELDMTVEKKPISLQNSNLGRLLRKVAATVAG